MTGESRWEPSRRVVCDRPVTHHAQALMRLLSAQRRPNRSMFARLGKCPRVMSWWLQSPQNAVKLKSRPQAGRPADGLSGAHKNARPGSYSTAHRDRAAEPGEALQEMRGTRLSEATR